MDMASLVRKTRSIRRFDGKRPVSENTLVDLVDLARLCPSAANLQPLKYKVVTDPVTCAAVFPSLGWAAYLRDWKGPAPEERPTGYIFIIADHNVSSNWWCDHGIAAQTILLGATEAGLGGCIIANLKKKALRESLHLEDHHEILLGIALGYPAETIVITPVAEDGDIRYWRNAQGVHHVPKRSLSSILLD